MNFSKSTVPSDEIELSSNDQHIIKNKQNDLLSKKNKKLIVFFSVIILILAGIGVLVGVLLSPKNPSSNESLNINNPSSEKLTVTPELITETSFVSTEQESLTSVDISKTNPSTTTTTITNDVTNTTTTTAICNQAPNSINYTQPSIKVNSLNGISLSSVYGIIEILDDISYFVITDLSNNRVLKLSKSGLYINSTYVFYPSYITKSQKYIYITSNVRNIDKLNYDLDQKSIAISENSVHGIHYDLSNNNIYIASWDTKFITVYHTNDEITYTKIASISTSYRHPSITTSSNKILSGTSGGEIVIYNKIDYSLIKVMNNMCSSIYSIDSVKIDSYGNMIYSCWRPPLVKIVGSNGINRTLLLSDTFTNTFDTYIDSKNRLWVGGLGGFVVFC